MNFSANIIENWLLSGKAVLKNLSCGNAGLVNIPVPEGKTYIITKIEILPFVNIIDANNELAEQDTFYQSVNQNLNRINSRNQYQLLFWNERLNNTWNIRNSFALNAGQYGADGETRTNPSNFYNKEIIDCFMIVESNSYLFLKYIDFANNVPTITQAQLSTLYNIQWPPSPYFGYSNQFDIINYDSLLGPSYNYVPQGLETNYANPSDNFNSQFVLPADNAGSAPFNTFVPPLPLTPGESGGTLEKANIQSIPLYNITYIEINQRLSTTGLL